MQCIAVSCIAVQPVTHPFDQHYCGIFVSNCLWRAKIQTMYSKPHRQAMQVCSIFVKDVVAELFCHHLVPKSESKYGRRFFIDILKVPVRLQHPMWAIKTSSLREYSLSSYFFFISFDSNCCIYMHFVTPPVKNLFLRAINGKYRYKLYKLIFYLYNWFAWITIMTCKNAVIS